MSSQEPAAAPPAGRLVRAAKSGRHQVVRTRSLWTHEVEQVFLEHLAATCNVRAAAAAAGFSPVAVYRRRRQWPAFAAAWEAAREEGWLRLELQLLHAATATLEPAAGADAAEAGDAAEAAAFAGAAMTVEQAMQLWFHRPDARGGAGRGRGQAWRRQEPDLEAVRASILRKIEAIERAEDGGPHPSSANSLRE